MDRQREMFAAVTDDTDLNELTGRTRTAGATGRVLRVLAAGEDGLADFSSIADALEHAAMLGAPVSICIGPGTFAEANPLAIPAMVGVFGSAMMETTVVATNSAAPMFTLVPGSQLQKLTVAGSSAPGTAAIEFDGSGAGGAGFGSCVQVMVTQSAVGFRCVGGESSFLVNESGALATSTTTVGIGLEALNGGHVTLVNFLTRGFDIGGAGENRIGTAVRAVGTGTLVQLVGAAIDGATTGSYVEDGGELRVIAGSISRTTTALGVGSGASPSFEVEAFAIDDCGTDLDLSAAASPPNLRIVGVTLDDSKIVNPEHYSIPGIVFSSVESSVDIRGELHVGTPFDPVASSFGGGDSYNDGLVGQTNTNGEAGTWADVTAEMTSETSSTFPAFPSTAAGATFYVGSDLPFGGIELSTGGTSLGVADLANITFEYWDGGSWVAFVVMATGRFSPHTSFANTALTRASSVEQVRFGRNVEMSMAQKTLNGIEKFWARIRVASVLAGPIPLIEQVQAHVDRFEVNTDGFTERFGGVVKTLPWGLGLLEPANSSPNNGDTYLGDNLGIGRKENLFVNGARDRSGFNIYLPTGIDTSKGIKFSWAWTGSINNGAVATVSWIVRWGFSRAGSAVYLDVGSAPGTAIGEQSISYDQAISPGSLNVQVDTEPVYLDVSGLNARPADANPDLFWLTIERDSRGANPADTYEGNIALVSVLGQYIEVFDGGHPEEF